jgi:small-conductance mechanosensitive channel
MKKWLAFLLAVLTYIALHEGAHALVAAIFGELKAFQLKPFGFEVIFRTPTDERTGIQWAFISGTSNVLTLLLGYSLLMVGEKCNHLQSSFLKAYVFYITLFLLLIDAFNLSIGPFIYGGDVNGAAVGLGVNRYLIQALFFLVMLANRELVAQKLFPAYNVQSRHPLFKPWVLFMR